MVLLRRNGLVSTFCNEICRANRLEPSERRPSEDEYHDGHVGQHAKDGDDIKQASFGRTACRAVESLRSVARPAASAESQIGADNHFWPVLFVFLREIFCLARLLLGYFINAKTSSSQSFTLFFHALRARRRNLLDVCGDYTLD